MLSTNVSRAVAGVVVGAAGYYCATHSIDVPIYRETGRQVLTGDYDIYSSVAHGGFRYAPVTALLFVPLALAPTWVGAAAIFALKVGALLATAAIALRMVAADRRRYAAVCVLAFVATAGYLAEDFRTGNIHFLSFFLVVAAMYLVERGRTVSPSVLLALATALKLTPLLVIAYYALRRRFALCLYTIGVSLLLLALPALFVGIEANNRLIDGFIDSAVQRLDESRNHSLRGVLFRYLNANQIDAGLFPAMNVVSLSRTTVTALWYALGACAVGGLAAGVALSRRQRSAAALEYALLMTMILLLSPHSLRMYFSILFFPLCILAAALVTGPPPARRTLILTVLGAVFAAGTLLPVLLPGREAALAYEALSPHFFVAAFVCASLAALRWKTGVWPDLPLTGRADRSDDPATHWP